MLVAETEQENKIYVDTDDDDIYPVCPRSVDPFYTVSLYKICHA